MKIYLNGNLCFVDWFHQRNIETEPVHRKCAKGGTTVCRLLHATADGKHDYAGEEIAAFSECSVKDNFSKIVGRKISYGRLLRKLDLPKEERVRLWNDYLAGGARRK